MVAIVRRYEPREFVRATPPREVTPAQTSAGALGAALGELGDAAWTFEDEIATAHAYQTDAEWTDFLRVTMHGDGQEAQGYLATRHGDAVSGREGLLQSVQSRYREMVSALNPRVRAATVRSMESRYQTVIGQINRHAQSQARAATAAASSRRTGSARAAFEADVHAYTVAGVQGDSEAMEMLRAARADELIERGIAEGTPEFEAGMRELTSRGAEMTVRGIAAEQGPQAARDALDAGLIGDLRVQEVMSVAGPIYEQATRADGADAADAAFEAAIAPPEPSAPPADDGAPIEPSPSALPDLTASRFTDQPLSFSRPEPQGISLVDMANENPDMLDPRQEGVAGGPDRSNLQPLVNETVAARAPAPPSPFDAFGLNFGAAPLDLRPPARRDNIVEPPAYVEPDFSAARQQIMQATEGNPLAREAALERLEDRIEAYETEMTRVHDAALQQAQDIIVEAEGAVGTVDQIPTEILQHLTGAERENLRAFERTVRANRTPETPDDVFYALHLAYETGDAGQLGQLLLQNRHQIAPEQYTTFMARHAAMVAGERQTLDDANWGSVRTLVNRTMQGFLIDPNDNPDVRMLIDNRVSEYIAREVRLNGSIPDEPAIASFISSQLVEATINPDGLGNQLRGRAAEFDFTGMTPGQDDDVTFDMLVAAAQNTGIINDDNTGLTINGEDFTVEDLVTTRWQLTSALGREPTMPEIWGALTRMAGIQ